MYKKYAVLHIKNPHQRGQASRENFLGLSLKVVQGFSKEHITDVLVNGSNWNPGPNEKVYFFPGCSVPRFKVREKFDVTIKPKYATAAFVPTTGLRDSESMFAVNDMIALPPELVTKWLEFMYGESHWFVVKFKSVLLNCEEPVLIYMSEYDRIIRGRNEDTNALCVPSFYEFARKPEGFFPKLDLKPMTDLFYYVNKRASIYYELYTPTTDCELGELKCPIYVQDEILRILNEGSITIDEKYYRQLRMMANSADQQDMIVAMELMANADYEKSFIYLLMLIQEFGHTMATLKQSNHVNFKGMLEFFDLDIKRMKGQVNIELLVATMKKLGKFTRSNIQRLTSVYGEMITTDSKFETDHFTKGPVLKREREEDLDEDDIVSDYDEIDLDQNMNL